MTDLCLVLQVDLDAAILHYYAKDYPFGNYNLVGAHKRATGFRPLSALPTRLYFEFSSFQFTAMAYSVYYFEVIVHATVSTLD